MVFENLPDRAYSRYRVGTWQLLGQLHAEDCYGVPTRVGFSTDTQLLALLYQHRHLRLVIPETAAEVATFSVPVPQMISAAEFSPDGRYVASCGDDNLARLWNAETGAEIRVFRGHKEGVKRAVFSPNGKVLATVSVDRHVKLWDVESGKLLRTLEGHDNLVDAAAFRGDGEFLATGDWSGVVRIWDAGTGAKRLTIAGYPGEVWSVAFQPDGQALVVAGSAHAVVYDLRPIDADSKKP